MQDFRDLQVLFNLAWTDPDFLAAEPLRALVARGHGYAEADKAVVLAEHRRIVREVIPLHRRLWEKGRIEVTTTPLAHPILPLIADTDFGIEGDPGALLPEHRYREIIDADQQVIRGLDVAERLLGRRPVGMWPAEGAVVQLVMSLFSKNGVRWVATGEDVLATSLGIAITLVGGSPAVNQTRILDAAWPEAGVQEEMFSAYPAPTGSIDGLTPDRLRPDPAARRGLRWLLRLGQVSIVFPCA